MARSTPKDQRIGKMIEAVLHEAKSHKNLLQLLGATLKKLREKNPHAEDAVLRVMIETMAASMPEEKRQQFLNEGHLEK